MNLEESILRAVGNVVESGKIEAAIEARIEKTILSVIDDLLGGYGSEFAKQVRASVTKSLEISGELDLPSYNDVILKIVRAKVQGLTMDSIQKHVAAQLEEFLTPAPEAITLSKLVNEFIKYVKERRRHDCTCHTYDRISFHIDGSESARGYRHIYLDEQAEKGRFQCDISLGTNAAGQVYSVNIRNAEGTNKLFAGPFYGFERMLFQMHAAKTKIVFDVEASDINTEYEVASDA